MRYSFLTLLILPILFLVLGCQTTQTNQMKTLEIVKYPEAPLINTNKVLTKIEFGACAHQAKPQPLWKVMLQQQPDLYIGTGDNIYASKPEDRPFTKAYSMQSQIPEFAEFRKSIPMIATWDDHDFGMNDGGIENPDKEKAKIAFMQFFTNDAAVLNPNQGGVYHSFIFGPEKNRVQIILLDTRYFRSPLEKNENPKDPLDIFKPTTDSSKTILGEEQWKWFELELQKPAEVRLIVSSIQFLPLQHGFEKWANFPHERQKMLDLIQKYKIENTIFLSGDRHLSEFSQTKVGQFTVTEVTASGINRTSTLDKEKNKFRVGNSYLKENFGLIDIDWKKKNLNIKLIDLSGKTISKIPLKIRN